MYYYLKILQLKLASKKVGNHCLLSHLMVHRAKSFYLGAAFGLVTMLGLVLNCSQKLFNSIYAIGERTVVEQFDLLLQAIYGRLNAHFAC